MRKLQEYSLQLLTDNYLGNFANTSTEEKKKTVLSLIKDIRCLLNSKATDISGIAKSAQLRNFIINYGLPELSYYSPYSLEDRETVSNLIKDCLIMFEPRLKNISVVSVQKEHDMAFHYKISGTIKFKFSDLQVILDSRIHTISKEILLTQENDA
jgi:type VI secretion system lysozyme-like protein